MKIIHVVWAFENGGIESMLINTANEQYRRGDKIFIIIINDLVDNNLLKSLNKDITVFRIGRKKGSRSIMPIIEVNFLVLFIYPQIMHFHALGLAKIFIKLPKIKFLATVHDTVVEDIYFKKYDKIIAISNAVKESLTKIKPDMETTICYNGIDFNRVAKKVNFYPVKNIICVGRLIDAHKEQSIIIKALKILDLEYNLNITVSFVGEGPDILEFKKLTKKLKLENNIKFLGNMPNEWILNNLCEYDLFIQASRYEGFGLTALEALGAKVPTLLSNVEGHLEISDNGKYTALFNSGDSRDLANKIIKLSTEFNLLKDKSVIAYNYVLEKFSTEKQVQGLRKIYNK